MDPDAFTLTLSLDTNALNSGAARGSSALQKLNADIDNTTRKLKAISYIQGPAQRLARADLNLRNAVAFGSGTQQQDAGLAMQRAQAAYQKAFNPRQPSRPGLGSAFQQAITSSRFSMNGGGLQLEPLIGRTMDVLMKLGPLGEAAVGAAAGIVVFGAELNKAAERLRDFAGAQFTSGGTVGETAQMRATAGGLGMSMQDIASLSRSFASKIASDPFARTMALQAGIMDRPGIFGKTDKATELLQWADALARMPKDMAVQAARATGTEQLLFWRNLTQHTRDLLKLDAQLSQSTFGEGFQQDASEFETAMSRLGTGMENLLTTAIEPFLKVVTPFVDWLATKLNQGAFNLFHNPNWMMGTPGNAKDIPGPDQVADATKDNTSALDRNTLAVETMHREYARSVRSREAIPSRQRYQTWQQGMGNPLIGGGAL